MDFLDEVEQAEQDIRSELSRVYTMFIYLSSMFKSKVIVNTFSCHLYYV